MIIAILIISLGSLLLSLIFLFIGLKTNKSIKIKKALDKISTRSLTAYLNSRLIEDNDRSKN